MTSPVPEHSLAEPDALVEDVAATDLGAALDALRAASPLVQCLTNKVVTGITANILLAAGAAPAMIDTPHEAADFAAVASGVLINLGTPHDDTVEAMRLAAPAARDAGVPWVLDPVAAGAPAWRTGVARDLVTVSPTIVRGNASEIIGLAGGAGGRGVDSTHATDDAVEAATDLARRYGTVVAVSGATDLVVQAADSGAHLVRLTNGDPMLTRVIGTGCALGALMAAYASVASPLVAAAAATAHLTVAADAAILQATRPGSFAVALLDQLDAVTADELATSVVLENEVIGRG